MTARLFLSRAAEEEFLAQLRYYAFEVSVAVADRFDASFSEALELVERHPHIGRLFEARRPANRGLRIWPLQGFQHVIFYRIQGEEIIVVHLAHAHQDLIRLLEE